MIDDPTLTDVTPSDPLSGQLQNFRSDPSDLELFRQLKTSLKRQERPADLAELYELRASEAKTPSEATRLWFDASLLRAELGDLEQELDNYRSALLVSPGHEKIANRLFDLLVSGKRYAEAADVADAEISHIESESPDLQSPIARRLASRYRALARLWQDHLGRLDRALQCWQRSFQLEPHKTEALEQSRVIYSSLGDQQMVITLYEAELQLLGGTGSRSQRATIELALGELKQKHSDMRSAAEHLQNALELDPSSEVARERLAESLTTLQEVEDHKKAGQLFVELGETRITEGDSESAISYLRRALGVDPESREGSKKLENVLRQARRWGDLDRLYQQQLSFVKKPEDRAELLTRRVELYETNIDDRDELKELLAELAPYHSVNSEFAQRLRALYEEDGAGEELVSMLEADLATKAPGSPEMIAILLELSATYREQLGDRDRAAETLHQILSYDPLNNDALSRYLEHFRERRDWRGLTDLNEYTIDQLRDRGAPVSELVERLENVAKLCETRLGDIDRAILTWQRIQDLEGQTTKTNEALRGLMSRAKMWESLVGVLEQEAEFATTPDARAEALKRIAQVYRERQVNPRRAISIYEEILTLFPNDEISLKSLGELYEREGDEAGLANTLRRQLDLDAEKLDARTVGHVPGTAREWPTAKRVERLTALRRLSGIYETELADVEGVVYGCSGILELLPGDREALERMSRVLEKAGDVERLEQTLQYHVACSAAPVERSKLLRRLALLAENRGDDLAATESWEKLLAVAPNDAECLKKLAALYESSQRHVDLAEVLDRALMNAEIPRSGSAAAAEMSAELKRFAQVLEQKLKDTARAQKAWQRLLEISERDRDALASLSRIYEESGQWRDLCDVLERQTPLYASDAPDKSATFALRRAELLEERLGTPEMATEVLEHLIAHVSPRNLEAHRRLRRLYEARGNFESAIRIAEREMVLTEDNNAKINRGLEIGILCRDRINDPKRALQSYERVLKLEPEHEEALSAASELYAQVGLWRKHATLLEKRIPRTANPVESRGLMLQIANVTAEKLRDHRSAFQWYSRAHELIPDETTLRELRRTAEHHGLWRELANVYDADREELRSQTTPDSIARFVTLCRDTAQIASERLKDPKRAMDCIHDALQVQPVNESLLAEAESIAEKANRQALWEILLECISLPLDMAQGDLRIALYLKRSELREQKSRDMDGALSDLLTAFSWAPDSKQIHDKLYEFGDRQKRWGTILTAETALAQRATSTAERTKILRRKASTYEEKANDQIRAFRTLISAFLLNPENPETIGELWRLARAIGSYSDSDRVPKAEVDAAPIERTQARARSAKPSSFPSRKPTSPEHNDEIEELAISDVELDISGTTVPDFDQPGSRLSPSELTQEIDISDMLGTEGSLLDPSMENRTEDLIEALSGRMKNPTPTRLDPPTRRVSGKGPPPPPPPRPQIKPQASVRGPQKAPPATPRKPQSGQKSVLPSTLPSSAARAYSSPWSELANAYCSLPARSDAENLRWRYLAAEAWEKGAKEVGRAFDVLATALRALPTYAETHDRLFQLASSHKEWDRLAQLYERTADTASSAEGAAMLLMRVATIRSEQGRPRETESLFRRVLGMQPDMVDARQALETLYRGEERWVDLAAQLEERTDPRLGSAAPIAQRPALLRELASLYSDKLSRRHDAIETLERLLEIEPENVELLGDIANLHEHNGKWNYVIQTLTRICDIADGQETARQALARIAAIYEKELELHDRAISSYSAILREWARDQDAFEALDRLYQQYARWEELSQMLKQRAAIVREPSDRAALLHRRALVILEWLHSPEEAATALRHARTIDPDNQDLADDLIVALTQSGREREAASILEGRIAHLRNHDAADGDVAALLIRLGSLRGEHLSDPIGAKRVLEEALSLVPGHPTALSSLANLTSADLDPRAHAEARIREAEAHADSDAKVEALLDAGNSYRDSGDQASARDAFQRILQLRPFHAEAAWALSALVEQAGDVDEAIRILNTRLDAASLENEERAEVLTQLAALSRLAGVEAVAERRLEEALEVCPLHTPALLGLADLLEFGQRWPGLEAFLTGVLPLWEEQEKSSDGHTATQAELLRRLSLAYEGMDRGDDAYQTLIRANRLYRGNILVKLALGKNRYKAKRWREAALHLSALAQHPDARNHPSEVAAGLYKAALAEIRSLRPDKAEALYEAALERKNNYAPALRALAEISLEKGDMEQACNLLTKQAVATQDAQLRLSLFESLGDMVLSELQDSERAKTCYDAALRAATPLDSTHTGLLAKLLARQLATLDRAGAGQSCELLASFATSPEEKCERHTEAAQHFLDAEMRGPARDAVTRGLNACKTDLATCDLASELAMDEGDFEATATMLSRLLNTRSPELNGPHSRTYALLWSRLADARLGRGDLQGAESCYEKSLEEAPTSPGAMTARRALVNMWSGESDKEEKVNDFQQILAIEFLAPDEVAAFAKALCKRGPADAGKSTLELASALGYPYDKDDVAFLARHSSRVMAEDEAYRGAIDIKARSRLIGSTADEPLFEISETLWKNASLLWNQVDEAFAKSEVQSAERISNTGKYRAAAVFTRIARALNTPATILYSSDAKDAPDVQVVCVSPPVIVFGPRLTAKKSEVSDLELRFLLGRAAELARPGRIIASGQSSSQFNEMFESLWRIFGDDPKVPIEIDDNSHRIDEHFRRTLPVGTRAALEKLMSSLPRNAHQKYQLLCQQAANRAGLLICGDIDTAMRLSSQLTVESEANYLLSMPLLEGYTETRAKLGIGAQK